ncbi:DNA-binding protein with winged-HTH domain [Novosphingobium sp. AP12]|nr:DNA-binding protein with winged-HTH domain [Novosphingobium sp. AP12]
MGSFREMRGLQRRAPLLGTDRLDGRPAFRPGRSRRSEIGLTTSDFPDLGNVIALPANDSNIVLDIDNPAGSIALGALEIRPSARSVLLEGAFVELGGRAFDLLMALLDAKGEIVSKEALLSHVWPGLTVDDSNLKVQLSGLRRALGVERWRIKTVSGRGYMLVAHDAVTASSSTAAADPNPQLESPLVIVIDGDRGTQELVMRALTSITNRLDGAARLALYSGDMDERAFA